MQWKNYIYTKQNIEHPVINASQISRRQRESTSKSAELCPQNSIRARSEPRAGINSCLHPPDVGYGQIVYSKDGPKRKCEKQSDFHWLGERWGGACGSLSLRLTSSSASGGFGPSLDYPVGYFNEGQSKSVKKKTTKQAGKRSLSAADLK